MKKCLTILVIKEQKLKLRYPYTRMVQLTFMKSVNTER